MLSKALLVKVMAVFATALVAGGIAFALTGDPPAVARPGPAQAWVDDPLDGSVLPPGPVAIVAHAYDPGGVAEMTLFVDGASVETSVFQATGEVLASAQWSWPLEEDGIYVIEVIGRNLEGGEGLSGRAVIEVRSSGSLPEPTTTTTTTDTTTTTTSATTTTTSATTTTTSATTTTTSATTTTVAPTTTTTKPPCTPPSPLLFEPKDGQPYYLGPPPSITFTWGVLLFPATCTPSGYFVETSTDGAFTTVVISEHFGASTTEWTPPATTWGCNTYYWRVWSKRSDGSLAAVSTTWEFSVQCVK